MAFFLSQFKNLPFHTTDLTGRVVIVTGANVGLGLESARHLAGMNPKKLIVACRNKEKGRRAVQYITETTRVSENVVESWDLDLSKFDNVKAFAKRVETELGRLDILVENAGVATTNWRTTVDSWEETIEVNVLSTFLLALLLLPVLRKTTSLSSAAPRLVILSSNVHEWVTLAAERKEPNVLQALNDKSKFIPQDRYPSSKLLDVLLTRELANHLLSSTHPEDKKISLSVVNPGLCKTELSRDSDSWRLWAMITLLARTAEMGARTLTHAAVGADAENLKGDYLSDCALAKVSTFVTSDEGKETQTRVWSETMEILEKIAPEVGKVF